MPDDIHLWINKFIVVVVVCLSYKGGGGGHISLV